MESSNKFVDGILIIITVILIILVCMIIGVYFYILINPESTLPNWLEWLKNKGEDING